MAVAPEEVILPETIPKTIGRATFMQPGGLLPRATLETSPLLSRLGCGTARAEGSPPPRQTPLGRKRIRRPSRIGFDAASAFEGWLRSS